MHRFAVILSHNRIDLLAQCVAAIGPQVDMVIVIDNASDPPVRDRGHLQAYLGPGAWPDPDEFALAIVYVPDQPPNLSRLWNIGIDRAMEIREASQDPFEPQPRIAVLCDDALPPAGWFAAVVAGMEATGAVVGASSGGGVGAPVVKTAPDRDLMGRMPGHAWILDPASPVRPDETFAWWWGDTDLDWQARVAGGMVMVGGYPVPNRQPDFWPTKRPDLFGQIGLDGDAFAAKHGSRPWL